MVQSNYGNYVLQNTLDKYSKCNNSKFDLIEAIINCLLSVSEYKIQQKWGYEILAKHLKDPHNRRAVELSQLLDKVMEESDFNYTNHKQQQTQKMAKMRGSDRDSKNKKSSGGGSNSSGLNQRQQTRDYDDPYENEYQYGGQRQQPQSGYAKQNYPG